MSWDVNYLNTKPCENKELPVVVFGRSYTCNDLTGVTEKACKKLDKDEVKACKGGSCVPVTVGYKTTRPPPFPLIPYKIGYLIKCPEDIEVEKGAHKSICTYLTIAIPLGCQGRIVRAPAIDRGTEGAYHDPYIPPEIEEYTLTKLINPCVWITLVHNIGKPRTIKRGQDLALLLVQHAIPTRLEEDVGKILSLMQPTDPRYPSLVEQHTGVPVPPQPPTLLHQNFYYPTVRQQLDQAAWTWENQQ